MELFWNSEPLPMEFNWTSDPLSLSGDEQDFPFGAKATSSLPSATDLDLKYDPSGLPDWMESRENIGYADSVLFKDSQIHNETSFQFSSRSYDTEEDYTLAIKPEDMLVPLSELQSANYAPQPIGAQPKSAISSDSKGPIHRCKVKVVTKKGSQSNVGFPVSEIHQVDVVQPQNSHQISEAEVPQYHADVVQPQNSHHISEAEVPQYHTDKLLNELVDFATKEPNCLTNLIESLDSSAVQGVMDDLLAHLEYGKSNPEVGGLSGWSTGLASPISHPSPVPNIEIPSPVPSVGSLSPQSTADSSHVLYSPIQTIDDSAIKPNSFVQLYPPTHIIDGATVQSVSFQEVYSPTPTVDATAEDSIEVSYLDLMSPCSEGSNSVSSSLVADDEMDSCHSKTDMHSYSRSPRKTKASRRSTPYPEGRKERKKEQNKQAALRYRSKKKVEDDEMMEKIHIEEKRQENLKAKYNDLKQELSYLKKLMREVLVAKGTISADAFKQ